MNLCVIPARFGSQRIKNKNMRHFLGKPIIDYAIKTAVNAISIDEVLVYTNDWNIKLRHPEFVTLDRPDDNANDTANLTETLIEALKLKNVEYDNICLLLPTAVFTKSADLDMAFESLQGNDSVVSMAQFEAPIERAFDIRPDGHAELVFPYNEFKRTQDFTKKYHDAGQFYWLDYKEFIRQQRIFMAKTVPYIMDAIDIDTEDDFKKAEAIYEYTRILA